MYHGESHMKRMLNKLTYCGESHDENANLTYHGEYDDENAKEIKWHTAVNLI